MASPILIGVRQLLASGKPLMATAGSAPPRPTLSLALDDFKVANTAAEFILQRKAGTYDDGSAGSADVEVYLTYTGGVPTNLQARVVEQVSGDVIKDWVAMTGITPVLGAAQPTARATIPNVRSGCYVPLQIRNGNDFAMVSAGAVKWGMGVGVMGDGQSNMDGSFGAGSYTDIVPAPFAAAITSSTKSELNYWSSAEAAGEIFATHGFVGATSGTGSTNTGGSAIAATDGGVLAFLRILAAGLKQKHGRRIPVFLVPWAFGSNGLATFMPGGANYPLITKSGTTASDIGMSSPRNYGPGDFEMILQHVGEADSSAGAVSRAALRDARIAYYENRLAHVAQFGRTAEHLAYLPAMLGGYSSASTVNIERMRGALLDLEAYAKDGNRWPRVRIGWSCIDLDVDDNSDGTGLHFAETGATGNKYRKWSNRRAIQAALFAAGVTTYGARGPRIASVTRGAGNTATVTIEHDGGAALALRKPGEAATGWSASSNGTPVAVTAATIGSANTVALTMAGPYTHVGYMRGQDPDPGNPVLDDAPYPFIPNGSGGNLLTGSDVYVGFPLETTPDDIEVT